MVNSILDAVTKQLGTTFGKKYRYYGEDVEQGLIKPCFVIKCLMPLVRSKSPILYDRTMPLVVHYFSDSKNQTNKDCYTVSEKVIECLEYLPFENTRLRAENISCQMTDDVLQIFLTYRFTTSKVVEVEDEMESLSKIVTHG